MTILARITTFDDLRLALNDRKMALGLKNLDVDEICGFQTGYSGKLFCGDKRPGDMSLPAILGGLGVQLALVPAPSKDEGSDAATAGEVAKTGKKIAAENGRKGGLKKNRMMTAPERSKHALRMNLKRWAKFRAGSANRTKAKRAARAKRKAEERAP